MARFFYRFRWHFLFWILYFIGWPWLSVSYYHTPLWTALGITLAWFLGQATMIYLTAYLLVPRLLRSRRIWLFFCAFIAAIFCCALISWTGINWLLKSTLAAEPFPFGYVLIGNFYWAVLTVGVVFIRDKLRNDKRNQRLEKEHTENELRFLKSQMNPHFLFNAINSIYVLIRKDPDLAEHTLARFSDMLRYQLYDCATDYIPIEKEITYLENYIRLEQLRKGPMLNLDYSAAEEVRHFAVAPLLLMPLVENAFKFVSSFTDRDNLVRIRLHFNAPQFHFEIGNTVDEPPIAGPEQARGSAATGSTATVSKATGSAATAGNGISGSATTPRAASGGIGLENVRRRLELLYPRRHELTIDAGKEYYTVSLKLQVL